MTKCQDLAKQLEEASSTSQAEVRSLKRAAQFLQEKNESTERAYNELRE